ncbi:MAG: TonB-dependent receptor [Alcanivorax sp.]|nr:TonB-dependent receptor [Alcanivorax sp.]MAY09206.1 TonB-dependent receptor [Alcanivorax sp.]MBI53544.1 TonB-dependent receptor [Alcanivorax sp.]HCE38678.1 TonB-dependent receptor [Alcanivorax sp.]
MPHSSSGQARRLPALMLAATLGLAPLAFTPAQAQPATADQEQRRQYDIAAGPLNRVLSRFAEQSGALIAGNLQLAAGKRSDGLRGRYGTQEALNRLLAGTGLVAEPRDDGSYALKDARSDRGAGRLDPVTVNAPAVPEARRSLDYDRATIEALRPEDVKGLFKKEASVAVGGSIPMNQKVYVRGVEETAMNVTVDGARQNNKVFHHNATNLIDPSLLKAARASAGVAAADDGPGALGGSLAYETVDVGDLLAPGDQWGGFLDGRYASNGDTLTGAGALFGRQDGFEALAYAKHADGDDYEDGNGDTVRFTAPALVSGLAKLAYEDDRAGRFELSHEVVNDDAARPYRANFAGLDGGRPVPESRVYDLTRRNTAFNYRRDTGEGLWNPALTVAHGETELDTREVPLSAPGTEVVYTGITESLSASAKNVFYTGFAAVTGGVDYYDDSATFKDDINPDLEEQAENTGVFLQIRQPLLDERLTLSYGARYDDQRFTGTDDSRHDDSGVSSNVFGEFQLTDHLSVNAGYADVWGGVVLAENYILNGAWDYRNLEAVEAHNHTFGFKANWNGFFAEANRFRTRIANGRVPVYSGDPAAVADFDIDGYDLTLGFHGRLGEVSVAYARIDSEKDGEAATSYDGSYFTAPLGELVTLNGVVAVPAWPLELGLSAEIALDNDDVESSGAKQEGYTVVDVYAEYRPIRPLTLRLSVDNLNDEAYADRATYGQEFTTVTPLLEPGRSIALGARYDF